MLSNYNWNIIDSKNNSGSINAPAAYTQYFWNNDNETVAVSGSNFTSITPTTFNIVTTNSNATNITSSAGGYFVGIPALSATASLSGSGKWPTTGSVTMSLLLSAPMEGTYILQAVSCSAKQGNITSTSGSGLLISYLNSSNVQYFVSASTIHHKGNEYNPLVNWKAKGGNPYYSDGLSKVTSSFQIVKDVNVPIYSESLVTASNSGSFNYDYNFGVTSSISSSWNWISNSQPASYIFATASLSIPEVGISVSSSLSSSLLTASFAANTNTPYTITASFDVHVLPAFSASLILLAGGGGGAAGGGQDALPLFSNGGGGGAGGYYLTNINVVPYKTNTLTQWGRGGNGGINTVGASGSNGTSSSLSVWTDINTQTTLSVGGGFGGKYYGIGGASGNGYISSGSGGGKGGGAGTVANATTQNGGIYLGGGAGASGYYHQSTGGDAWVYAPGVGAGMPTINLPAPFNYVSYTPQSGSGGNGSEGLEYVPGGDGVFGGGGGGASENWTSTSPGGKGGDGGVILAYYGVPKLTFTAGACTTTYDSGSNVTVHYVSGSGASWNYIYNGTDFPYQ